MSRCKTGWRIVRIPFGGCPWVAFHERSKKTHVRKTWAEAFFVVYEATSHLVKAAGA